uniref:protease complex subunit PrcB family protein n=1 Tax=Acetatifactor sp. TaxID=1872090 RepID=UPI004057A039
MKKAIAMIVVFILAAIIAAVLSGCTMLGEERVKLQDLDFTVLGEEKIPEELLSIINEKKGEPFKLTYSDKEYLYISIGYGEQTTGGYSIAVNELYLTDSAIYVNTELLGPELSEKRNPTPSYPYIVIKIDYMDQTVIFE